MTRYYFYHANYYTDSGNEGAPPLMGEVHGIWIVEDDSTPDVILAAIEAWLYDEWDKKRQGTEEGNPTGARPPASVTYAITQFNLVQ